MAAPTLQNRVAAAQMLAAKATPGPWTSRSSDFDRSLFSVYASGKKDGESLADCFCYGESHYQDEANAAFIAAGPDHVALITEIWEAYQAAEEKAVRYDALNTPEIGDFLSAVENEALHQRERWGSAHDAGKTDPDWFWLIGHLAGKALLKPEKALHHIITTAAACLNWHAQKIGASSVMRPGIGPDAQPPKPAIQAEID